MKLYKPHGRFNMLPMQINCQNIFYPLVPAQINKRKKINMWKRKTKQITQFTLMLQGYVMKPPGLKYLHACFFICFSSHFAT